MPINKYSIYLYTSLYDGLPNSPIEAALCGLPIVASNVGGLKYFIQDKGQLVDNLDEPKDYATAIISILNNPAAYTDKSDQLKEKAFSEHSENAFNKEVALMLKGIGINMRDSKNEEG